MLICIYVNLYICIFVYMYICIYVYMYICIYVNLYAISRSKYMDHHQDENYCYCIVSITKLIILT